uniref:Uncharacterized protein n=1 Tax=Arundo donax TaxID=35708 RepID=A0A0A8ZEG5_ARUDO
MSAKFSLRPRITFSTKVRSVTVSPRSIRASAMLLNFLQ